MGHFPEQRNLVGPSGPSKKWPTMTTDQVPAGITEKRPFLRFAKKPFFGKNSVFSPENTQNLLKDWYSFGKRVLFLFAQLFPVLARTWFELRSVCFFLAPKLGFRPQNPFFCHWTPNFVNSLFVALGKTLHFAPWDWFFDFSFPSYGRFRKKKTGRRAKKSFPTKGIRKKNVYLYLWSPKGGARKLRSSTYHWVYWSRGKSHIIVGQHFPRHSGHNLQKKLFWWQKLKFKGKARCDILVWSLGLLMAGKISRHKCPTLSST